MAEVFVEFGAVAHDGRAFVPRACGAPMDKIWQGWIEFTAMDDGEIVRTPRETTQPNRTDLAYWATGLSATYLEGAIARALSPRPVARENPQPASAYDAPAPALVSPPASPAPLPGESVLDPFSVYQKGERVLRQQLGALASWHLVNIIRAYKLSDGDSPSLESTSARALVELIVAAVRAQSEARFSADRTR
jgi:hypothetical protein